MSIVKSLPTKDLKALVKAAGTDSKGLRKPALLAELTQLSEKKLNKLLVKAGIAVQASVEGSKDNGEEADKQPKPSKKEKVAKEPKQTKKELAAAAAPFFDPYVALDDDLTALEKQFDFAAMSLDKDEARISTGMLQYDLILGGGLVGGGWYTFFGPEQSCKSTTAMTVLAAIMKFTSFKGRGFLFDYEGSTDATYVENIMKAMGVQGDISDVFGLRDNEGEYSKVPRVRMYAPQSGEAFFDYVHKLIKKLPDKIKMGSEYYFVYKNTRENQQLCKGQYDKKYFKKYNKFKLLAENGDPQAIVLCDSFPAMLPAAQDEDEDSNALALQARMFSDGIKRVKGSFRRKRLIVLGVNQLRLKPMVKYGTPEYEPCGEALKFFSDVRLRNSGVSIPHGKGQLEEEPSIIVSGGTDQYRYIKTKAHKNKLSTPYLDATTRLCIKNANGDATGFCPTWDTYNYLLSTGQVQGNRAKMKFSEDMKMPLAGVKALTWMEFKMLIEGTPKEIKKLCKDLGVKPVRLRSWAFKQCGSGKGPALHHDYMRRKSIAKNSKVKKADDSDSSDEFD